MLNCEYASSTSSWVTNRYLFAHQFLASYFLNFVFPFITEGWVLGLVLGWVLGGVLGLVFVFCIPFTQRHFRKIGVGLSKTVRARRSRVTRTERKTDEPAAQGSRTGSSIITTDVVATCNLTSCTSIITYFNNK